MAHTHRNSNRRGISVCSLRNAGIISDDCRLINTDGTENYDFSDRENLCVIKRLQDILSINDVDDYLETNSMESGRTSYMSFPDHVVYQIIHNNRDVLKKLKISNNLNGSQPSEIL